MYYLRPRFFCACFLLWLVPEAASRGLVPEDNGQWTSLADVQISPDGKYLATVASRTSLERNRRLAAIMVTPTAESRPTPVGRGRQPRWARDSQTLAFISLGEKRKPQIFLWSPGEKQPTQLSRLEHGAQDLVWSPEGSRFAVLSPVPTGPPQKTDLGVVEIDHPMYEFNGPGFFLNIRSHIFVVDAKTGKASQITDGDAFDRDPTWSPDGKWIAFTSDRSGKFFSGGRDQDIFVVSALGGDLRCISPHEEGNASPQFSPDGRFIAFTHMAHRRDTPDIWIMPVGGGDAVELTGSLDRRILAFQWTRAGMFYTVPDQGAWPLMRLDPVSKEISRVAGLGKRVTSFSVSDAGEIAYIQSSFNEPGDLYLGDRRLTRINEKWLQGIDLPEVEKFKFRNDGGLDVAGWLVKPVDWKTDRKYPLVIWVHGGPRVQAGNAFRWEVQLLAARGYAVSYVNYRGSDGYGGRFLDANAGDMGGGDYRDVMQGVGTVLAKYAWIDSKRVGLYGRSYGGYMANWAVTQTDRFAAAVSFNSISNLVSYWGTGDNPYELMEAMGASPWEQSELYWDRSPIKHALRAKTPTLLVLGERDDRTPPEQAEQMFRALKHHGVEAKLIRYPDVTHGAGSWKPVFLVDSNHRMLDWFDRFLKN